MLKSMGLCASVSVLGALDSTVQPVNVGALFDNLQISPLFLVVGGVVLGFFLARKFPGIFPSVFAPPPDVKSLVKEAVAEAMKKS